jgi:uroporphyrinogen decarboxylase
MRKIRDRLPQSKALLGFVGGPLTLFYYAVEGSPKGELESARRGLKDGRYAGFVEKLMDLLVENMALQARGGADAVAVLDTCAGELDPVTYREVGVPVLKTLLTKFKALCPNTPVVYYSKGTGPAHWDSLIEVPFECLGVDWNHDIAEVLKRYGERWSIQGNINPDWLFLEPSELEHKLREVFNRVRELPAKYRRAWVCGLGHGVLPKTPESNVKLFIELQREIFDPSASTSAYDGEET